MSNSRGGGRPSKGQRDLLATRAPRPVAELARKRAEERGFNVNDYLLSLIAKDIGVAVPVAASAKTSANNTAVELPIPAA